MAWLFLFVVALVMLAVLFGGRRQDAPVDGPVLWLVQLDQGKVVRFEGAFPPTGWRDVQEIALAGAVSGEIRFRGPGAIEFSDEIGAGDQQRFRNVLARVAGGACLPGAGG